ncbi:MAG: hypothetical protein ACE5GO_01065 [Anaerolineales bacterium]
MSTCILYLLASLALSACQTASASRTFLLPTPSPPDHSDSPAQPSPYPTRPLYKPGELVAYTAQTGDTLPALAAHFNTTTLEILAANPFIPENATTMPPGMPMQIPIYYLPFWGTPYQILPDSLFVNGPVQVGFDTEAFVASHPGWLKDYVQYAAGANRSGAGIVDLVALNFSVSPRLLLALLDYQTSALSNPAPPANLDKYPLGYEDQTHKGLYLQLLWAADKLNDGYYRWRTGDLLEFELRDGRLERPDPWQNAATVSLQYYFAGLYSPNKYTGAISSTGFAQTYHNLFGDPWEADKPHIPGSLQQPAFILPFEPRKPWTYTGGPHTGWGTGAPLAALDFAPPSETSGCFDSKDWSTAVAPGVVVRSETGIVVFDLDGEGDRDKDERTGWVVFYLHIGTDDRATVGDVLNTGDPIGHPSCEGGTSTGSHTHIARKYNGEWMPAEGPVAFNLSGWVAYNGAESYQGTLKRFSRTVTACECSNKESQIQLDE